MDTFKAMGISEVIIYCVNDGAVMQAWAEDQKLSDAKGFVTMMGDPSSAFTQSLDMVLDHPGPMSKLGYKRCKRFALYLEDGVVKIVRKADSPADPAGDDYPEETLAPAMIAAIKALELKDEM